MPSTPWAGISPDATRLAYLLASDLWVAPAAGGSAVQLTRGAAVRAMAGWSRAGDVLAYLAPYGDEAALWLVGPGFAPRVACRVPRTARSPAWAGGDGRLTFAARVPSGSSPETPGASSGSGSTGEAVFVCDPREGSVRQVTSHAYHGLGFAWAPAGDRLAISMQERPGFYEGLQSDLMLVDPSTGDATPLVTRPGVDRSPMWSPDGTEVAFVSGFGRSGLLPNLGLAVIRPGAEAPRDIGKAHDRGGFFEGPALHGWSADGQHVLYSLTDGLANPLFRVSAAGGGFERVPLPVGADEVTYQYSVSTDAATIAYKVSATDQPPDLYIVAVGEDRSTRITYFNESLAARGVPRAEPVRWSAPDGTAVEGVLLRPPASAGPGPHPLVTILHGGPASAYNLSFPGLAFYNPYQGLLLAGHGYAVFLPNPRGSGGYGEGFRSSVRGDWGAGPAADVHSGIDHLIALGIADSTRLALTGWSYGGYLGAWMLAHSDRFAVASLGAGVFDLTTHYGLGAPQLEEYFGGPPWQVPALYHRQSPIYQVANITTPTLIFHGESDNAVSIAQSELLLAALLAVGTPTELVRYPGEGHSLRHPASQDDSWNRLLSWLERWLSTAPTSATAGSAIRPPAQPSRGSSEPAR